MSEAVRTVGTALDRGGAEKDAKRTKTAWERAASHGVFSLLLIVQLEWAAALGLRSISRDLIALVVRRRSVVGPCG
jgi:hypothetical protein